MLNRFKQIKADDFYPPRDSAKNYRINNFVNDISSSDYCFTGDGDEDITELENHLYEYDYKFLTF